MTEIQATLQQKEKTAQFLWTGFILMFFVIQAIVWIVAITLTANDKSHAVLPNYDERALKWNEEVALRAASEKLVRVRVEFSKNRLATVRPVSASILAAQPLVADLKVSMNTRWAFSFAPLRERFVDQRGSHWAAQPRYLPQLATDPLPSSGPSRRLARPDQP